MKPVLTPQEAVDLDRRTQAGGISADTLMERAGRALAQAGIDLCGGVYGRRGVVVCGKGNNGGDGFVAARHLARRGMRIAVVSMERVDELREPAATNAKRLGEVGVPILAFEAPLMARHLDRADVAVDAIFGTGFRGVAEDAWGEAIEGLNASSVPVVSADIPSGVDGSSGAVEGAAVDAAITVTFGAAKAGVVLLPGAEHAGTVRVVDIGFDEASPAPRLWIVERSDVADRIPRRPVDTHKRASGVVVVVAGSRDMPGAPSLVASAAQRIGAGLAVVAVPRSAMAAVQAHDVEAVFVPLPETDGGAIAETALAPIHAALEGADALALGPGLSRHPETVALIRSLVRESPVPTVLDADGISAFAGRPADLADRKADLILTPHRGEFLRLTGMDASALDRTRIEAVRTLASDAGAVTLLKGSRTLVSTPDGQVRINLTGGPVLATAGSGDILTGVVSGLLARGLEPADAASCGAYLHGEAGRLAGEDLGEGTLASDVAATLPAAVAWTVRS